MSRNGCTTIRPSVAQVAARRIGPSANDSRTQPTSHVAPSPIQIA
jgi:hypothetical protein